MEGKLKITNIEYLSQGVEAINDTEFKKFLRLEDGDYFQYETWKERDINKHKKYFALIDCAIYHLPESMSKYNDTDLLRKYVMILIGECDLIPSLKKNSAGIPQARSISFKNMDQIKFDEIYNKSLKIISNVFLRDIKMKDFEDDILNFY